MKLNVAFLVYDISLTGGAEKVALNIADEMSKKHNVHLISIFSSREYTAPDGYVTHFLDKETKSITKRFWKYKNRLKKYLKEKDIDILFSITAGVVTVAVAGAAGTKTKVVYCEHSNLENKTYGKKHQLRQRLGTKFSDKIITLTERDRDNFISMFKTKPQKVGAIPNWIDPIDAPKAEYNKDSKLIISVGRLEFVKGYDMLLRVAAIVKEKHGDWHWDIYGEGTYQEKLQNDIEQLGLSDFVTLKGNVSNISQLYQNYAFLVMTSYYEGLPLVLLEAQNENLPIISFDCPTGPSEIVQNGKNGTIVPCYDIVKMAESISSLIDSQEKRIEYSKNARNNISHYSKASVLKSWEQLICELIK